MARFGRLRDKVFTTFLPLVGVLIQCARTSLIYASKDVSFAAQRDEWMCLRETCVTDNHWSVREEVEAE